ncbi:type II toxin-antitoxin system Phd/YefM family antitoxin [Salinicoccus hispanicus]|uniref:type II toxin-antitoxin system Phd/YefM family antitoxin n=1 Tax=Salinicoccus hispanicus TaxID=157225 RepID=UPI001B85D395|nr:type II toxin-antitoxin system Phd/YefM family antitoxin [Salinicoccus hispanicus]
MLKTFDLKTKSVTEAKKDFSKIIKDTQDTGEPVFIFNHNKPEAVIISNEVYETLIRKYEEMEDQLFYNQLQKRVDAGPGKLVPSKEVLDTSNEPNPFQSMPDKDLFD